MLQFIVDASWSDGYLVGKELAILILHAFCLVLSFPPGVSFPELSIFTYGLYQMTGTNVMVLSNGLIFSSVIMALLLELSRINRFL